ncbi:carbon-nitrogen hydrolase [Cryphonectria parasitica EP155]|uniref:Carbon-nitrogen hydrolase n=1 Tax=Cryphonectria parasitica (strain ATCC 38755 / EP155) TaxID=660469 RepID=A0A9P4XVS9_CRYP1|nr:carbon-nitrogen hydrolase [Cryphonectria parasitica EP155]KAF3761490.1 carbon-nitrogen hydrolase [Cryphonectria parasitica EP155]
MAPIYKFALIQMQPKPVDPAANFAKAEAEIRKAAAAGCHLAILPEYHLTSWVPEHPDFITACADSEAYLARYQALARELNISLVPGTICEAHPATEHTPDPASERARELLGGDRELRNMAHFIAAGTGAVSASYQKKNLWHPERPHLSPGRHEPHSAFDTPLTHADGTPVRAGMLVCWDLAFPEAFRALIADGAELVLIPSFWLVTDLDEVGLALNPDSEKVFLDSCVVSRAFENTCAVVFCNKGGCSQVAMPIQGRLKSVLGEGESRELGLDEDGVSYVEVDLDVLRIAEENYKVREDIRGRGWHYGYELARDGGQETSK